MHPEMHSRKDYLMDDPRTGFPETNAILVRHIGKKIVYFPVRDFSLSEILTGTRLATIR